MRLRPVVTVSILLFWGVMMALQIHHEYMPARTSSSSQPAFARQAFSEYITREKRVDYLIQNGDREAVGDMQRTLVQSSPEIVVEQRIKLELADLVNTGEQEGAVIINKTTTYEKNGQLQSFKIRFTLTNDRLRNVVDTLIPYSELAITGEKSEDGLKLWFGKTSEGNPRTVEPTTQISSSFNPMGGLRPPEPGTTQTIRMMDPMGDGTVDVQISTSSETHELLWQDQRIKTHKVTISSSERQTGGVEGTVWVTTSGTILRQRVSHPMLPFDLHFLRITSLPASDRDTSSK